MPQRLRLRDHLAAGERFLVGSWRFATGQPSEPHCHDFAEVYAIRSGRGWLIGPDGREPLAAGDVALVAPDDVHGFASDPRSPMTQINLAFPVAAWRSLRDRYSELPDLLAEPATARRWRGGEAVAAEIVDAQAAASGHERSPLALDRFLLAMCDAVTRGARPPADGVPPWLAAALAAMTDNPAPPRVATFVRRCGRSREHVARETRRHFAASPTELVNAARLERAARLLEDGGATVADAAFAAGFSGLAHFYTLFRRRFGLPPQRWRRRHSALLLANVPER